VRRSSTNSLRARKSQLRRRPCRIHALSRKLQCRPDRTRSDRYAERLGRPGITQGCQSSSAIAAKVWISTDDYAACASRASPQETPPSGSTTPASTRSTRVREPSGFLHRTYLVSHVRIGGEATLTIQYGRIYIDAKARRSTDSQQRSTGIEPQVDQRSFRKKTRAADGLMIIAAPAFSYLLPDLADLRFHHRLPCLATDAGQTVACLLLRHSHEQTRGVRIYDCTHTQILIRSFSHAHCAMPIKYRWSGVNPSTGLSLSVSVSFSRRCTPEAYPQYLQIFSTSQL